MKKTIKNFVLCLLFCLLFSVTASGETVNTYELDELGMSIDIPTDYVVFTREIEENDPNLATYGLTKDDMSALMLDRSIYLNAWDEWLTQEIVVTMMDVPTLQDFHMVSDTALKALMSALPTEYEKAGITYIGSEIYRHSQAKFIKIYISQSNGESTKYGLQYYTAYDGKAINVTLQSQSGQIGQESEALLQQIVDTVRFTKEPQTKPQPEPTNAFTYTDEDSGLTFTVPANWVETPMTEEREYIDVKFMSNLEEGMAIIFLSEDLLAGENIGKGLSVATDLFADRSMVGNDYLTTADIAEILECKETDISLATYNGKEYYLAQFDMTGTVYGLNVSVPSVCLVRIENGYLYTFQFSGAADDSLFEDFEKLINSVVYPQVVDSQVRDQVIGANILLVYILFAIVYVLPIMIYRWIKKEPIQQGTAKRIAIIYGLCMLAVILLAAAILGLGWLLSVVVFVGAWVNYCILIGGRSTETFNRPDTEPQQAQEQTVGDGKYCRRCGNKLPDGSVFCHQCGTKIFSEEIT